MRIRITWQEIARDLNTSFDLIMAAQDDNELWDSIAIALQEARNEGRSEAVRTTPCRCLDPRCDHCGADAAVTA